jgi:hypothetical protein
MFRLATIIQLKLRRPIVKFNCGIDLHATTSFLCFIDDKDDIFLKLKKSKGKRIKWIEHKSYKTTGYAPEGGQATQT